MYFLQISLLSLIACSISFAQSKELKGTVINERQTPVEGATVLLKLYGLTTTTNSEGQFQFVVSTTNLTSTSSPVQVSSATIEGSIVLTTHFSNSLVQQSAYSISGQKIANLRGSDYSSRINNGSDKYLSKKDVSRAMLALNGLPAIDTLVVTKTGYETNKYLVTTYIDTTISITILSYGSTATYREAWLHPFAANDPFNIPLATNAVLANAATDLPTLDFQTTPPTKNPKGVINHQSWSIGVTKASLSDPIVTIRDQTNSNTIRLSGVRLSPSYQPPLGSAGYTADASSVIIQPDGRTAHDVYKLIKVSDTVWTSTSAVVQFDLQMSGVNGGRRAAGLSFANGLIRSWEIDQIVAGNMAWMPHALSMSIPKEYLKLQPDTSDGQLVIKNDYLGQLRPVAVWPATQQDNQQWIPYSGSIAMGSLYALPWNLNVDSIVTGVSARALARTLQRFGVYITDQSSTWALYAQPNSNSTAVAEMTAAWKLLIPHMRRVTNNTAATPGGGTGARRAPMALPFGP